MRAQPCGCLLLRDLRFITRSESAEFNFQHSYSHVPYIVQSDYLSLNATLCHCPSSNLTSSALFEETDRNLLHDLIQYLARMIFFALHPVCSFAFSLGSFDVTIHIKRNTDTLAFGTCNMVEHLLGHSSEYRSRRKPELLQDCSSVINTGAVY